MFFACHDPPVVLYQGPSIGHFLHETFRMSSRRTARSSTTSTRTACTTSGARIPASSATRRRSSSDDAQLADFAATLEDDFEIVDLRDAEIGMGFSWGRYGPRTELRRHGDELLFAYRRPPRRPRRGLFSRR